MNKVIQILLIVALFPAVGFTKNETLEERKQRIMRKYLRAHARITQSDMAVPVEGEEDERVVESERFDELPVEFDRHEGVTAPPPPDPRRMARKAEVNWLLEDEDENDPYADPFAKKDKDEDDPYADPFAPKKKRSDSWPIWGEDDSDRTDRYDAYSSYGNDSSSDYDYYQYNRSGSKESSSGNSEDSRSPEEERYSRYGRKDYSGTAGGRSDQQNKSWGTSDSKTSLQSSFMKPPMAETQRWGSQVDPKGFVPENKSYKPASRRQPSQWNNVSPAQQPPEFKREDSYQQWKARNKASDEAILQEQRR